MRIEKTYQALYEMGICTTQVAFSRDWLGSSERYFSHLLSRGREPHLTAVIGLVVRLEKLTDYLSADPRYAAHTRTLNHLIDDLWDEVRARALAAQPKRRPSKNA